MKITSEIIEQVANLSRLRLSEKEKKMYAKQVSAILDYIEILNEVDTSGVAITCQVTGLEDITRDDLAKNEILPMDENETLPSNESETASEIMAKKLRAQFPEADGRLLKVKAIFT